MWLAYKLFRFAAKIIVDTIRYILRMAIISYLVYIITCIMLEIDSANSSNGKGFDLPNIVYLSTMRIFNEAYHWIQMAKYVMKAAEVFFYNTNTYNAPNNI